MQNDRRILDGLKQMIFGVKDCNCNRRRKDGYHNVNCESWKNAWNWKKYQQECLYEIGRRNMKEWLSRKEIKHNFLFARVIATLILRLS